MKNYNLIIGNNININNNKNYLIEALNESINNNANAMMIYTGLLNNNIKNNIENFFIKEFNKKLKEYNFNINNIIIHAPYIINLANTNNNNTFKISIKFLKKEIIYADKIGIKIIVLHPGNSVGASEKIGLNRIVEGLNLTLTPNQKTKIALETMSGKGSELGINFLQLKYIIDNVKLNNKLGICWDTCHMHDAGYKFKKSLNNIINEFDKLISLKKLLCLHINDSKNILNTHKDRHENIGYGYLGFKTILKIIYHPKLNGKIKILETPYILKNNNYFSPYKEEIEMIRKRKYKSILIK